jgi:transposase InsO family protein
MATRDAVIAFIRRWSARLELPIAWFVRGLGIPKCTFFRWSDRLGVPNNHNSSTPKDGWLASWEKQAIIHFHAQYPLDGYRRLAYMMLDRDIVRVSPSSVYRVLKAAGLIRPWNGKPSRKGTGFQQPENAHKHWHIDVSYINIAGTFYYLCGVLDGYSRFIVHWEIRTSMTERDVETIVQRARERVADVRPRIISDNGPQFIARDFKQFIRICGMDHVRTSPYYPQSNGKIERWHGTLKVECIRPKTPLSLEEARRLVSEFVTHYNNERLHSAIGYIAPRDKLEGRAEAIWIERRRKLEEARLRRAREASEELEEGLPREVLMA